MISSHTCRFTWEDYMAICPYIIPVFSDFFKALCSLKKEDIWEEYFSTNGDDIDLDMLDDFVPVIRIAQRKLQVK